MNIPVQSAGLPDHQPLPLPLVCPPLLPPPSYGALDPQPEVQAIPSWVASRAKRSEQQWGISRRRKGAGRWKNYTLQTSKGESWGDIKGPKKLFVINMYYTSSQVKRAVWNGCGDVSSTHCEHGYLIICRPACLVPTDTQLFIFFLLFEEKRNKI